jgi:hypothetical protein
MSLRSKLHANAIWQCSSYQKENTMRLRYIHEAVNAVADAIAASSQNPTEQTHELCKQNAAFH